MSEITTQRLQQIPIFKDIPIEVLAGLVSKFQIEQFAVNEMIIHQNNVGDKFYCIESGRVEIFNQTRAESHHRIATLEAGDFFGEVALIKTIPRVASAVALEPTICFSLSHDEFNQYLIQYPEIKTQIEKVMRSRLGLR